MRSSILGFTIRLIHQIPQLSGLALKFVEPQVQYVTNADHSNKAIVVVHGEAQIVIEAWRQHLQLRASPFLARLQAARSGNRGMAGLASC